MADIWATTSGPEVDVYVTMTAAGRYAAVVAHHAVTGLIGFHLQAPGRAPAVRGVRSDRTLADAMLEFEGLLHDMGHTDLVPASAAVMAGIAATLSPRGLVLIVGGKP